MNETSIRDKRQSLEKPVTNKDIANLYSHLQTMMENVPKSPQATSFEGFLLTPTPSSTLNINKSISTPIKKTRVPDCACHHIFVSRDSEHCALCDDVIPILSEIQQDREDKRREIKELKEKLDREQDQSKEYKQEITLLEEKSQQINDTLEHTQEQCESLKRNLKIVEDKCEAEKKEAEKARKEKQSVENELEELSQKLFEEANGMVANEKKEKHLLEIQYKNLQEELRLCREQIETEELQLKELKEKMGLMDEQNKSNRSSVHHSQHSSITREDVAEEQKNSTGHRTSRDYSSLVDEVIAEEETLESLVLSEFKQFVDSGETIPIRKLHNSVAFIKNSLIEDVEPCLRFGPNSRLSSKKLYEAILLNTCFIEETPAGFPEEQANRPNDVPLKISASKNMIWERLSSTAAPFAGCQACGRNTKSLPYRFRISTLDDWACIDRYCRDRLVSVCEFYVFLRNVRQGYYSGRSIPDLYQELLRLKLQMFYARTETLSKTLYQFGMKSDVFIHALEPNTTQSSVNINDSVPISPTSSVTLNKELEGESTIQEDELTTEKSGAIHPVNSVWLTHSF